MKPSHWGEGSGGKLCLRPFDLLTWEGISAGPADHLSAICFLCSVYMQIDALLPSARIFLAER